MQIKKIKLTELKVPDRFLLSFPVRPELYRELREKLAHFPLIFINRQNEIVFGSDYYVYLKSKQAGEAEVVRVDIAAADALFFNYNLKEKLTGLNLYEKLVFIKKITPLAEVPEIYRRTGLDISINRELSGKLDMLVSAEFRDALIKETVTLKSALTICDFQPGDRGVLRGLFSRVSFTASHRQKILEMVQELLFRDKCSLAEIFGKLEIEKLFEREKPQKAIVDVLFMYRYPVYAAAEKRRQEEVKALDLPDNVRVVHSPFFEKKGVEVTLHLRDTAQLKEISGKIREVRNS